MTDDDDDDVVKCAARQDVSTAQAVPKLLTKVTATIVFEPWRLEATDSNLCPTTSPNTEEVLLVKLFLQCHQM